MVSAVLWPLRRFPAASFVVLAYLLSWRRWIEAALWGGPREGLGSFGPFVAAVLVLLAAEGDARPLLRRLVRWRVPLRWYALAVGLPIAVSALALGAALALGVPAPPAAKLAALPQAAAAFPLIFLVGGPLGEEPGWRGFLQPRLRQRLGGPLSGLAVGLIWALWHLPLLYSSGPAMQAAFLVEVCAVSVLLERMDAGTGGSVLLAMLLHATENVVGPFASGLFEAGDRVEVAALRSALFAAAAAAAAAWSLHRTRTRPGRPTLTAAA